MLFLGDHGMPNKIKNFWQNLVNVKEKKTPICDFCEFVSYSKATLPDSYNSHVANYEITQSVIL